MPQMRRMFVLAVAAFLIGLDSHAAKGQGRAGADQCSHALPGAAADGPLGGLPRPAPQNRGRLYAEAGTQDRASDAL